MSEKLCFNSWGNTRNADKKYIVDETLNTFKAQGCKMSLKVYFLQSHINCFPKHLMNRVEGFTPGHQGGREEMSRKVERQHDDQVAAGRPGRKICTATNQKKYSEEEETVPPGEKLTLKSFHIHIMFGKYIFRSLTTFWNVCLLVLQAVT